MDYLENADQAARDWMLAEMSVGLVSVFDEEMESGLRFEPFQGRPRLQWFPCAVPAATPEDAWQLLFASPGNVESDIVVEGLQAGSAHVCEAEIPSRAGGQASFIFQANNELRILVEAQDPGWLLVRDTYYPGWQAAVNGAEAEVHPANYLFRALRLPAGQSEVVLRYQPFSFYLGAGLSGLTALGLALYAFRLTPPGRKERDV
jgi:hypothetical protein